MNRLAELLDISRPSAFEAVNQLVEAAERPATFTSATD
jgi:Mn-dependent DtxR family transcriptional regulator